MKKGKKNRMDYNERRRLKEQDRSGKNVDEVEKDELKVIRKVLIRQ